MFGIDKLEYDPALPGSTDTIGAHVLAGTDGDQVGSQTAHTEEWLNAAAKLYADDGGSLTAVTMSGPAGAIDVNVTNSLELDVNLDGVYNVGTNADPDNVGIIAHTRLASPGDAQQTFRPTGGIPDSDGIDETTIHALDTNSFLHGWDSANSEWDRVNIVGGNFAVSDVANTTIQNQAITVNNVGETEVKSAVAKLTDRKYLYVQNLGPRSIYVGATGVSSSNGIRLAKNTLAEFRLGQTPSLFAIGTDASSDDVRVMAFS